MVRVSRGASLCNHEKCEAVRDRLVSTANKERVGDESEYVHSDRALTAFLPMLPFRRRASGIIINNLANAIPSAPRRSSSVPVLMKFDRFEGGGAAELVHTVAKRQRENEKGEVIKSRQNSVLHLPS